VFEVREFFDGTIILSGSISSGSAVASSLALGADLAYLGTRFIATEEANADQGYKDMLIDSVADDIVYSSLFTGVHGNYLKGSVENAGLDPNNLPEADKSSMNFGSGGNTDAKAWKDIWGCGQGIGAVKAVLSAQELVDKIEAQYNAAKLRLESTW
jgi:nitronate monooxygenase